MNRKARMAAESAIKQIALREGKTLEYVREQTRLAMLHGLHSADPQVKAYWDHIPRQGEEPTPEEWIAYATDIMGKKRG